MVFSIIGSGLDCGAGSDRAIGVSGTLKQVVVDTSFTGSAGNNGISTATRAKSNLIGNF